MDKKRDFGSYVFFTALIFLIGLFLTGCNQADRPTSPSSGNAPKVDSNTFLGVLNTETYPTAGCRVIKTGEMISLSNYGYASQPEDIHKGYLSHVTEDSSMVDAIKDSAISKGFNAVLAYKHDVFGGFTAYGGSIINGNIGLGVYISEVRGTPVTVQCN